MKLLTQLGNIFKRAAEGVQNLADLNVDQQWALIEGHLKQERLDEAKRLKNLYPAGWFKMARLDGSHELNHYCPNCKTLSQGKVALHCNKRESRPEGWRLALLPKAPPKLFI